MSTIGTPTIKVGSLSLPESVKSFGLGGPLSVASENSSATIPFANKSGPYVLFEITGTVRAAKWHVSLSTKKDRDVIRISSVDYSCSLPNLWFSPQMNQWEVATSIALEAGSWAVCNGDEITTVELPNPSIILERCERFAHEKRKARQVELLKEARASRGLVEVLRQRSPITSSILPEPVKTYAQQIARIFFANLEPNFEWSDEVPYLLADVNCDSGEITHIDPDKINIGYRGDGAQKIYLRQHQGQGSERMHIYLKNDGTIYLNLSKDLALPPNLAQLNGVSILQYFE